MFCFVAEEINFLVSSGQNVLRWQDCWLSGVFSALKFVFSTFCFAGLVLVLCLGVLSPCLCSHCVACSKSVLEIFCVKLRQLQTIWWRLEVLLCSRWTNFYVKSWKVRGPVEVGQSEERSIYHHTPVGLEPTIFGRSDALSIRPRGLLLCPYKAHLSSKWCSRVGTPVIIHANRQAL